MFGFHKKDLIKMITFVTVVFSPHIYADFGLIQDKDGEVNIRDYASLKANVVGKLKNNQLVDCLSDNEDANFCLISTANHDDGYVYKNRINFFKAYHRLKLTAYEANQVTFSNAEMTVQINAMPRESNDRLFKADANGYYRYYKNKTFLGTDGEIPNKNFSQLQRIDISYRSQKTTLAVNQMGQYFFQAQFSDLTKSDLADFEIYYLNDDIYLVNHFNYSGAAAYNLMFHLRKGQLVEHQAWKISL
ncbi:SH3 domain-containing protein [Acinetobacter rudis]|uniref:SH3 domain-containing protein n=1 Tax=Acinetobacter rudis TaxID=632955 RepID=A0AAW8J948_9GAMM|nr:SH3 domain-containing protein [Acinetobacter rudis]MDQ8936038.1 SH3 domain-containing protein [Acinetobacter rudis]MDQ8953282.1 SH3 domain-containing protein [Acinetobacter rudis]MDQ9018301.1 SH3 domain-containing protein [Acinetobacter rudis]